jgi:hypothetical protein
LANKISVSRKEFPKFQVGKASVILPSFPAAAGVFGESKIRTVNKETQFLLPGSLRDGFSTAFPFAASAVVEITNRLRIGRFKNLAIAYTPRPSAGMVCTYFQSGLP